MKNMKVKIRFLSEEMAKEFGYLDDNDPSVFFLLKTDNKEFVNELEQISSHLQLADFVDSNRDKFTEVCEMDSWDKYIDVSPSMTNMIDNHEIPSEEKWLG